MSSEKVFEEGLSQNCRISWSLLSYQESAGSVGELNCVVCDVHLEPVAAKKNVNDRQVIHIISARESVTPSRLEVDTIQCLSECRNNKLVLLCRQGKRGSSRISKPSESGTKLIRIWSFNRLCIVWDRAADLLPKSDSLKILHPPVIIVQHLHPRDFSVSRHKTGVNCANINETRSWGAAKTKGKDLWIYHKLVE